MYRQSRERAREAVRCEGTAGRAGGSDFQCAIQYPGRRIAQILGLTGFYRMVVATTHDDPYIRNGADSSFTSFDLFVFVLSSDGGPL